MMEHYELSKIVSGLANGSLLVMSYYQYKGRLNYVFPIALLATTLFLTYGILKKDVGFIISNGFFLIINTAGTYKWTIKRRSRNECIG